MEHKYFLPNYTQVERHPQTRVSYVTKPVSFPSTVIDLVLSL